MGKRVIILFGAGASLGCGGIDEPPPDGKHLFECLANDFPDTWGEIPEKYAKRFHDFEDGMGALYDDDPNVFDILKDMTIFFSRFSIDRPQDCLYCDLVSRYSDQLSSNDMIIATINYECLIELAILSQAYPFTYLGGNPGMRIYKIHGSCNFLVVGVSGPGSYVHNRGKLVAPLEVVHPMKIEERMANMPVPAAMSLYVKSKETIIAPEVIDRMVYEFQSSVLESDLAIVIGVRPNVDDKHIWDVLAKMEGDIALIGNEEDCKDWLAKHRNNENDRWLGNIFQTSYDKVVQLIDD